MAETESEHPNSSDWITQREVARLLGVSPQTASTKARRGQLRRFEHGISIAGRRKYSRALVERELKICWREAVRRQDSILSNADSEANLAR